MSGSVAEQDGFIEGDSPEDVTADLATQLREAESQRDAERIRREQAERNQQQASAALNGAHDVAITSRLQAEESAVAGARARMKQARETGDLDAEADAVEQLATARQNVNQLKAEQGRLAAQRSAPPQREQQQSQGATYSPQAQAWIQRNPRFNTDRIYRSVAEGAHAQAVESGITPDTPAYFKHLDDTIAQTFPDHQQEGPAMTRQPPAAPGRPNGPRASSMGAPPNRGNISNGRAGADVNAIAGRLGVSADDVRQFAETANMKVEDYCKSQEQILDERKRGGSAGLHGSDQVFR